MEDNKELLTIVGDLYTQLYRLQFVARNLQSQLQEQKHLLTDYQTQVQTLEKELSKATSGQVVSNDKSVNP